MKTLDLYLTTAELAELLRYTVTSPKPLKAAHAWAKVRQVPSIRRGSVNLYPKAAVLDALHRKPKARLRRVS